MRPRFLLGVTGTGTDVGKTWVGAELLERLYQQGLVVSARKPVQSFSRDDVRTDADVLALASRETPTEVCPPKRWYPVPMAPPIAADLLGLPPILLADLERELGSGWPLTPVDVGLVEGAGGVASPLATNGDVAELARALGIDMVVVVALAELGAINSLRLSRELLGGLRTVVYLNRYDPEQELHVKTLEWLVQHDGFHVMTGIEELFELVVSQLPAN